MSWSSLSPYLSQWHVVDTEPASRFPLKEGFTTTPAQWSQAQSPSVPGHALAEAAHVTCWGRPEHKCPATLAWHGIPVRSDFCQGSAVLAETFLDLHLLLVFSLCPVLLPLPSSLHWCCLLTNTLYIKFNLNTFGCGTRPTTASNPHYPVWLFHIKCEAH